MVFSKIFFASILFVATIFVGGGTINVDVETKHLIVKSDDPNNSIKSVTAIHKNGTKHVLNGCGSYKCSYNIEQLKPGKYTATVNLKSGSFSGSFIQK